MNYLDKVRYLIERQQNRLPEDPYFYDVNPKEVTWELKELESICQEYTWLPISYIDFLKEFDGIAIAFCRFYGSKIGVAIVLQEEITFHQSLLKDNYFPFGCFPSGSVLLLDRKGAVRLWSKDDYDFEEEPTLLAETFEEFVGECLLGKRYREFSSTEGCNFFAFLQSQGWA